MFATSPLAITPFAATTVISVAPSFSGWFFLIDTASLDCFQGMGL